MNSCDKMTPTVIIQQNDKYKRAEKKQTKEERRKERKEEKKQ